MRWAITARWSLTAVLALGWACAEARAQSPAPAQDNSTATSVADAAKQSSQKKKAAASAAKVITDDDINPNNVKPGEEGLTASTPRLETEPPPPAAGAAAETADAKAAKNPAGDPVKNMDLWQRLLAAEQPHDVEWKWVRGHDGDVMNERADRLATEARERLG